MNTGKLVIVVGSFLLFWIGSAECKDQKEYFIKMIKEKDKIGLAKLKEDDFIKNFHDIINNDDKLDNKRLSELNEEEVDEIVLCFGQKMMRENDKMALASIDLLDKKEIAPRMRYHLLSSVSKMYKRTKGKNNEKKIQEEEKIENVITNVVASPIVDIDSKFYCLKKFGPIVYRKRGIVDYMAMLNDKDIGIIVGVIKPTIDLMSIAIDKDKKLLQEKLQNVLKEHSQELNIGRRLMPEIINNDSYGQIILNEMKSGYFYNADLYCAEMVKKKDCLVIKKLIKYFYEINIDKVPECSRYSEFIASLVDYLKTENKQSCSIKSQLSKEEYLFLLSLCLNYTEDIKIIIKGDDIVDYAYMNFGKGRLYKYFLSVYLTPEEYIKLH